MKKRLVLIVGGVAAALVLLIVVVSLAVDVNQYRGVIEARLERQLGRDVTLGELSLGLLPPRFQVSGTSIAESPAFGDRPVFVSTDRLAVRIGLLALLGGNIQINSLELDRPNVELVRNADGVWNFSTLGPAGESPQPDAPASPSDAASTRAFVLERLVIRDGQVAVSDLGEGTRAVYDHIDVTVRDFAPGEPFSFDVAAHLPGEGAGELRLAGDGGPIAAERPMDTPFRGTLALDEVGVGGLKAFLQTEMLADSGGSLSGETGVVNQPGSLSAVGHLELDGARFNGVDVGYPIGLDYDVQADLSETLYTIRSSTIQLGETPLSVSGRIDAGSEPANIELEVTSGDVSIEEVARLASAFGLAFAPDTSVTGRVSMNLRAAGALDRPAFTGNIAGRGLRISGANLPQPVEVAALDLALSPSEIRSNEFEIRSGDTTATARFALTGYASDNPAIDARLRAPGATLTEIQSIARAYGMTGLDQLDGAGSMNLDLAASGPLASLDTSSVVRALNGNIDLDFSPLSIAGFDTARELGAIGGFNTGRGGGDLTELLRLNGQIVVRDGVAQTDDLLAALAIGKISAAGTADLTEETLDLRLAAVLSEAFSQSVGGTGIGGYMSTALANSAGEIVLPVRVTGSFRQPQFAPDLNALARMQRERLLPTFDDPAAAVSGLLGAFAGPGEESGEGEAGQNERASPEPAETIRGVLEGLLGGRSDESN